MTPVPAGFPLDACGPRTVWGLGEPTHGSANAAATKWAVIEALARRTGVRVVFEESASIAWDINQALHGAGDLCTALLSAKPIWRTTTHFRALASLQDLIASGRIGGPVDFLGADVQHPGHAAQHLWQSTRDSALAAVAAGPDPRTLPTESLMPLTSACTALVHAPEPVSSWAQQLLGWVDTYGPEGDLSHRDVHLAEAVLRHIPDDRPMVVWAHNEHVAHNADFFGSPSMGHLLREQLGAAYTAVALLCGGGACRAVDAQGAAGVYTTVPLSEAHGSTSEASLAAHPMEYVTGEALHHPGPRRFIGWRVDPVLMRESPHAEEYDRPLDDFDAVVHLGTSIADESLEPDSSLD